jgi:excinuclease ABC subunit A
VSPRQIEIRGARVHNLQGVDLDIPLSKLTVLCGVSGSGKTSLALDTLYAEGQRRYIESFSAYARQVLARLEKPAVERIDHLPAAVAVTHHRVSRSPRTTIGAATEIIDYLRLLYARVATLVCPTCDRTVRRDTPQTAAEEIGRLPSGTRIVVGFSRPLSGDLSRMVAKWSEQGFVRAIVEGQIVELRQVPLALKAVRSAQQHEAFAGDPSKGVSTSQDDGVVMPSSAQPQTLTPAFSQGESELHVVVDRLAVGSLAPQRLLDSLETAFRHGDGECFVAWESPAGWRARGASALRFTQSLRCTECRREFAVPEPKSFSFDSPLGACPTCEGFGEVIDLDMELIVPDPDRSLRDGAIAPWTTPAFERHQRRLLEVARAEGVPVDLPFRELSPEDVRKIRDGIPQRDFGGLAGFFAWLDEQKQRVQYRALSARYKSPRPCPECHGMRLTSEALAWRLGGKNIAELAQLAIDDAAAFFGQLDLAEDQRRIARTLLEQVRTRLMFLQSVGLGYVALDRTLRTLSSGEVQRVALTATLGSSLVNMLYVLDEPSVGLHPSDVQRLLAAIQRLRDRGNTVVVVEHEETVLRAADWLVEIGPGAGENGGRVTFAGTPAQMLESGCLTGEFLAGRRGISIPQKRRTPTRGRIRLLHARGNNLQNLTVEFPLGVLCLVTGVSGAGKSSLVQETLYGALCRRKRKACDKPLPYGDVVGDGQIDDVILVDQTPIGRSPRSNPVTYIKAFDAIRAVFAETVEARTHNYTAGHFSFNVDGGRCDACQGEGYQSIDMQFLSDVFVKCPVCRGTRYRKEILAVTYRGKNIAEVLEMTVREAFGFFRGQPKVQARLKQLIDVGLDYLRLGQPANTLSGGEAQRLKLAGFLSEASRNRTLFLLDEPTTGLHFADVVKLLDCFDALLDVGHSLIVVEHNVQLMRAADWIIDLGPGAAAAGGRIVVQGTPEQVAASEQSLTGRVLRESALLPVPD